MRRAPAALAVIACCGSAACTGPELPDHLSRSEHVRYFSRGNDVSVCPALLDEMEEHGRVISDALGTAQTMVTYYKFRDRSDFEKNAGCPEGSAGCALNATTRTPLALDRHELIHAYLAPYGLPPPLLGEGAAVALSCEHYPRPTGSWRDAYAADTLSRARYSGGGWLAGYLLHEYAKSRFLDLYGSVQVNATADQFAKVFAEIYEMPLDTVWTNATSGPQQPRYCPWECSRPAVPADGAMHALSAVCASGTTQMTVDVPDEGVTRWLLDGDAHLSVQSCDGNEEPLADIVGGNGVGALLAPLKAGKYFINATLYEADPPRPPMLSVEPHALAALSSGACATAAPVTDDVSRYQNLTLFFPSSDTPQFTTFAMGRDDVAVLNWSSDDPSAQGNDCVTCDVATCTPYGTAGGLGTATPTGQVLGVPPGPAMTANIFWFPTSSPDAGM
ncbi:MAG TPA: hypothetical protein VN903_20170 [Polyangia bacterium]|jgi:hypothetical protein|nr:hypothetical protein [Polyangia bacterium]